MIPKVEKRVADMDMLEARIDVIQINLKSFRESLGLTQQQFAVRLGVSVTTISRLETGRHKASPLLAARLAELAQEKDKRNRQCMTKYGLKILG